MIFDVQRDLNPCHLQESFDRAAKLKGELRKKESRIKRQAQQLAWGLAAVICRLTTAQNRVSVAVLVADFLVVRGGQAGLSKRALKTAQLDPGDSDEPGPHRRITLASYEDYEEFIERLPRFLNDVIRDLEAKIERTKALEDTAQRVGTEIRAAAKLLGRESPKTHRGARGCVEHVRRELTCVREFLTCGWLSFTGPSLGWRAADHGRCSEPTM